VDKAQARGRGFGSRKNMVCHVVSDPEMGVWEGLLEGRLCFFFLLGGDRDFEATHLLGPP